MFGAVIPPPGCLGGKCGFGCGGCGLGGCGGKHGPHKQYLLQKDGDFLAGMGGCGIDGCAPPKKQHHFHSFFRHIGPGGPQAVATTDGSGIPGDVIGSGTVGTGCLLETTRGQGPWLQRGDVVELEVERLGTLRNTIV